MAFLLPIEIFAETTTKNKKEKSVTFDSLAEAEAEANIVTELTNRRDEYTKHFRMDDGTIMAVTYDCPVHYKNSKGKWVEYDNSLIDETSAIPDEAKAELYTNKKSDIDIDIASNTSADTLVSISTKKGNISWRYTDSKKSDVKIKNPKNIHKGNEKFTSLDKISSKATYKEFYKNIDLDCIASTIGVKENIILNNSNAQNEFEIEYEIKGLKAQKVDNQTIQIKNSNGKTIYIITAPCMYDSKGVQSTNLTLNIISNKNGKLKVKLIADKSFINEKGRAFPVTIDPEVTVSGSPEIETAQVADTSPNAHLGQQTNFWVGKNEGHSYYGFVQVKNLQENYADKNIVSAKLTVFPMSRTPEMEIEAHPISESWSNNTASFSLISNNNNEVNDTEVIDYAHTKQASANGVVLDLTKYAKKWARGSLDNNGVYLSSPNNYGQFGGYCCYYYNSRPTFVVKYKEYIGSESNLTSHTVSCGQNAEASVCDYTGSLTVKQNIYEETGARIPMSIYATHHSANINQRSYLGKGWHMSFDKRLTKTDYYYVYLDADAVEHYFKIEAGASELSDEDDLGYTLTINTENNNNTITIDTGSAIEAFDIPDENETTHIKTETDSENSNNQITYTYDSTHRLTQIQSAQHTYTFTNQTVTSDGESVRICNNIKKDNSAFVYFVYYTGLSTVHSIKFSDGRRSQFSYNNSRFLSNIRQYSTSHDQYGNKLTFSYNNGKVSEITEFGDNNTSIHSLSVQCNDDNTTVFKADNDNNKKETYTFDNYGNTVTVLNANGMITNASDSGSLNINTGSDSYTKNYIMDSNEPNGIDGTNNYESGHASIDNQQSSGGTVSIDNETAYLGHKSIKIEHNASSAIYTFAHQTINGTALGGKSATFSAYVKPDSIAAGNLSGKSGAMLKIKCYKANGVLISEQDSAAIISTPNETGWERISVTTSVSSETVWMRTYIILRNAQGTAYFDCLQLEEGEVMNDYNALLNSDFRDDEGWLDQDSNAISLTSNSALVDGNGGEPAPEATEPESSQVTEPESSSETSESTSATSESVETSTATEFETFENDIAEATDPYGNVTKTEQGFVTKKYLKIYEKASDDEGSGATDDEGDITETEINPNKFIYQRVAINKSNVVFNISGTAKADSVPLNNEYRTFGIVLKIIYALNEGETENQVENHYQEFNAYTGIYQNVSLSVTPYENRTIESVDFAFVYGYNKNKMTVKNAMLNYTCYDEAEEQTTTESTEPSSSEENTSVSDSTEPSSENNDSSEPSTESEWVLVDEIEETAEVDESKNHIKTSATYNTGTYPGNYVMSEVDEAGNTVSYDYDNNGNVSEITDGRGNTTSYSYDTQSNLLSVSSGNSQNTYTYNSRNNINSITHNNFSYNYSYDNYGNLQSVNVGNTALASYTYNSGDTLSQMQYGNGDKLKYTYDSYDRITTVKDESDNILAEYCYNKKGLVTRFTDGKSGETTDYVYDCNGNTMSVLVSSESGTLLKQLTGDVEKTKINGREYTIENGTDENDKEYVAYGGVRVTTDNDDFGRTSNVTSSGYTLSYTYKDGSASNSTTNLVDTMTYELDEDNIAQYTYTYDANGNITQVKEGNTIIASYLYDSLNQLLSVNYRSRNLYFTYHYDNSGNITSQSIQNLHPNYGYPIGSPETITYTYGDTDWKDKLTSYDGDSITYDNIGNPMSYRDGMIMQWQNGRELASITKSGTTYSYKYNLDGLRTQKIKKQGNTVLETVSYNYDSNNNLVGMKKGSDTVLYYYDSDGGLVSMSVEDSGNNTDTTYLFIKNLQGDITKILDDSGDVVATYAYDAWGKILAENEDNAIAGLNPFRYRGYTYEPETELYYLQSRYYDPLTGRFLNADSPNYTDTYSGSPLSTNMFAYCENNPINHLDSRGTWIDANNYFLKSFTIPILLPILLGNTKLAANIIAAVPILYLYLPARFYLLSLFNKVKYEKYKFSSDKMIGVKILNSKGFHDYLIKEFSIRKRVDSSNRSLIKEQIKKLIKSGIKNKRYPKKGKDSIYFYEDSHDLYLSIGAGKCAIRLQFKKTIKKNYQKWKITISLSDKYNFESWDKTKNNELTKALNNIVLGIPMTVGILTPYKWKYTYTYTEIIKVK